jgi:UDP-glucose 4-epimerase
MLDVNIEYGERILMFLDSLNRRAVVTGGAGFIGSHITERLVERGWHVVVIDDLSTGKIENIQRLISNRKIDFVEGSIADIQLLKTKFSDIEYIFHQAAYISVAGSIANPILSHEINVSGTLNVLVAARENRVKKVIFASSSAIYGDSSAIYKKEDLVPNPKSPYAVNKLAAEYYCRVFEHVYNLPTICLRYFNVYGPRQNSDSEYSAVIPKFINSIETGKSYVIYGDGNQTRDFVFVKDVADANIFLAESEATGIFNVGTSKSISINHLSQTLLTLMNRDDIKPIYEKERSGDIRNSLADISKIREMGYLPKYKLQDGLREIIRAD